MSATDLLISAVVDHRETVQATGHRAPRTAIEFDHEGALITIAVLVEGKLVASASARTLDRAANRCLREFLAWTTDEELEHALEVSVEVAKAGGLRQ